MSRLVQSCLGSVAGEGGRTETSSREEVLVPTCPDIGGSSFSDSL